MSWELYMPPARSERNAINGRFLKGHHTWNKGKTWSEQGISDERQKEMREQFRERMRPYAGKYLPKTGHAGRPIYQLSKDGERTLGWFKNSEDAARKLGMSGRNIRSVCNGKRHTCGGFKFIYADR